MKILFKNCKILLLENGTYGTLNNAYLGIDGDVFSYIGTAMPDETYDVVKDYSGKLIMPGLYNCHTHSPMVLFRGAGSDKPLHTWLFDYIFPLEAKLTAAQIKAASELAMMEMIASGTVSFTDMYFFPEVTAQVVKDCGIKANLAKHIQFADQNPNAIKESLEFINSYNGEANGRILADYSIHSLYTCDRNTAREYTALCNEAGGRMHIHLSETDEEYNNCFKENRLTPTQWFAGIGALNEKTTAAHCVILSKKDIDILVQNKVNVVHCPTSNLKLGSGFAPIPELIEKGASVTLGTDGAASNNNLNLFEEMHLAAIIHNGRLKDTTVMDTDTVIKMATVNGAKAQGRDNCGEIKPGYKADCIAIDLEKAHLTTGTDSKTLITYSAQGSDVFMTMVDGKILYEAGDYLSIDKDKVLYTVNQLLH